MKNSLKTLSLAAVFAVTAAGAAQAADVAQPSCVRDTNYSECVTVGAKKASFGDLNQHFATITRTDLKTGATCTATRGYAYVAANGTVNHIAVFPAACAVKTK